MSAIHESFLLRARSGWNVDAHSDFACLGSVSYRKQLSVRTDE